MSSITVCARFRNLSSKEIRDDGDSVCIRRLDSQNFVLKDDKDEECTFCFDRVFYQGSEQAHVYEFLGLPIVRYAVNGMNGAIITYGQTGAGKTYSMEGPNIMDTEDQMKGLLPRVVDGIFEAIKLSDETNGFKIKLSMVEIYMEKVRDLFDLSKDNIQIKEHKAQGILLSGVTEIVVLDPAEALKLLHRGIANRAVGETQMNMASSRSHCIYIFTVQNENDKRGKAGKLILVDLAGSEKAEKTGAEGKVLEEAKTINKSLSALGNVISALTCNPQGKANHIPYRDSKLTRILQDALGGNSQTALLCCCSPSPSNALETVSTLRFGARAKHIKSSPHVNSKEQKHTKKQDTSSVTKEKLEESRERILHKLGERLHAEDVQLLEELFVIEGIFFDPNSIEEVESAYEDVTFRTISALQTTAEELGQALNTLKVENVQLKVENADLMSRLRADERNDQLCKVVANLRSLSHWVGSFFGYSRVK